MEDCTSGDWVRYDDSIAWGAQQREAGKMEAIATLMRRINHHSERAEKAEAQLAVELGRVQDYYTRWRCERENPTDTHRLDTWQAACGKARAERDKAEARIEELEFEVESLQFEIAHPSDDA